MTKQFNYQAAQSQIDTRNNQQQARAASGIPGVGILRLKENDGQIVRFLTPFSLGMSLLQHTVQYGANVWKTFVCDKNFSLDSHAFCPVCQFDAENPNVKAPAREVKNFLVYSYTNENKYNEGNNGTVHPKKTVNVMQVTPGKDQTYWRSLQQISEMFGLSGVDIQITRTGKGLNTLYTYQAKPVAVPPARPGDPVMQSGAPFDWNRIPQEVVAVLPPLQHEPFNVEPLNPEHTNILNAWGDFYIKASGLLDSSEFVAPDLNQLQAVAPVGQQPMQQGYGMQQQGGLPNAFMPQPQQAPYNPNPMVGQPYQQPQPMQQPQMPMPQGMPVQQPGMLPGQSWS